MHRFHRISLALCAPAALLALSGCLSDDDNTVVREPARPQDARTFTVVEEQIGFDSISGLPAQQYTGVLEGAGYRVEVPEDWNGNLVMYAHGFRGEGAELTVDSPPIRRHLLEQGYAWAASSYSANYYDVRAGVEDTNRLALAFSDITGERAPGRIFITGVSMGGHVAGAAIERATRARANNVVAYDGAVPMCGVMGDTELFDYFGAYNLATLELGGAGADAFPITDFASRLGQVIASESLWQLDGGAPAFDQRTAAGNTHLEILQNLSGGPRPIYPVSYPEFQELLLSFGDADGTVTGILNDSVVDTRGITYSASGIDDTQFTASVATAVPVPGANRQRADGLRWIPRINGEFDVPVVTLHTLGDLFVPFSMQQIYARRAAEFGNDSLLVQRAIRAPAHCDFAYEEQVAAFDAMTDWVADRTNRPAGDDVLDPATVADPGYGCTFTTPAASLDPERNDPDLIDTRERLAAAFPCGG